MISQQELNNGQGNMSSLYQWITVPLYELASQLQLTI